MTINKEKIYVTYQDKKQELFERENRLNYLQFSEINQRAFKALKIIYDKLKREVEELEKLIESLENSDESMIEFAEILK